jgi:hypothetical protein
MVFRLSQIVAGLNWHHTFWEEFEVQIVRVQDLQQCLEYLHSGPSHVIVHRDQCLPEAVFERRRARCQTNRQEAATMV